MKQLNWWKSIASFLVVLFTMPLGHALMMIMDKTMTPEAVHYSAFFMGLAGLIMVVIGVFVEGDTKQTLWGLFGGLLFWTGWIEFLFQYYATRWGTQPEMENGEVVTRPEYLILPATFGMWMMMMVLYIFSTTLIVKGCIVSGNGNHIFLPYTEAMSGRGFLGISSGSYWTDTLNYDEYTGCMSYVWSLIFGSDFKLIEGLINRINGHLIRPVLDDKY